MHSSWASTITGRSRWAMHHQRDARQKQDFRRTQNTFGFLDAFISRDYVIST